MTVWIIGGAVSVAAYVTGRARPWKRLRAWSRWQVMFMNFGPGWRGKAKALFVLALQVDGVTRAYWRRWRDRNKPPPEPVKVGLSPKYQALVDQARAERSRTPGDAEEATGRE